MRVVAALGGNALLERGERPEARVQEEHVHKAALALAPLAQAHRLVLTHGNGPQVGLLALANASAPSLRTPYPFDVLGAQTQGMIGYWLLQAMQNALPDTRVACLVSRTVVSAGDPAFGRPTKFVGPVYDKAEARALAAGCCSTPGPSSSALAAVGRLWCGTRPGCCTGPRRSWTRT